ncbi:TlpA family protein disulfide reductase [Evansella sp. AB-rgal1]|uniref:TlpA family protein disulfide reductase n=1 Tax=Evansella sp. AB-rgal1 TaxID=3242696 RepID=UPI00359D45CF
MNQKGINLLIASIAILFIGYVVYDYFFLDTDTNQQLLEDYFTNPVNNNETEDNTYSKSNEVGASLGKLAPNVTLDVWQENEQKSISDYKGSFVILNAWASWCGPCRDEIPYLIEFHENYLDENVTVLGVNMTTTEASEERVDNFTNDFQMPYDLVMDREGLVRDLYRINSMPTTIVIDPDGRITERKLGYATYDMIVAMYESAREKYDN